MKVICIEDRVYNHGSKTYSALKLKNITKGKVYTVENKENFSNRLFSSYGYGPGLHYYIIGDMGLAVYYFHSRFKILIKNINNKIQIL